jgi:hypothetical protein
LRGRRGGPSSSRCSRKPGGRRFATDKLPANYLNIGLIRWILPRARFVYCRRTPEDTALSIYEQNFGRNITFASDLAACGAMYRDHLRLMDHWQDGCAIPVHTVDYEALVGDPEPHIRALLDFVGLKFDAECLKPEKVERSVATANLSKEPVYKRNCPLNARSPGQMMMSAGLRMKRVCRVDSSALTLSNSRSTEKFSPVSRSMVRMVV